MGSPYRQPYGGYDKSFRPTMPEATANRLMDTAFMDEWYRHWVLREQTSMDECIADALLYHARRGAPGL